MELKLQDYEIGDFIEIKDKYYAVVTEIDKYSLFAIALNYPHKEGQTFIITKAYLSQIKKVIHE